MEWLYVSEHPGQTCNAGCMQARTMKKEIAELLMAGRNDNAVIRTEAVILQVCPFSQLFCMHLLAALPCLIWP